jgi:hypothetical protein
VRKSNPATHSLKDDKHHLSICCPCWEKDLNLRRHCRQIYSLLPLAARASQLCPASQSGTRSSERHRTLVHGSAMRKACRLASRGAALPDPHLHLLEPVDPICDRRMSAEHLGQATALSASTKRLQRVGDKQLRHSRIHPHRNPRTLI